MQTVKIFPWLAIQGQPYHVGIWADEDSNPIEYVSSNTAACIPEETPDNACSMSVGLATPGTAGPVNPPQFMEPGGFFGPLIKALISIGIFILQAIAQFLGWVADAFITALNAVGGFFGLGTIGTSIRSFFTDIGGFIANVFGTVVGWLGTISSLFQNGIGFITNFFSGSNGFVAWIISWFTSIGSLWAIVQDLWTALNTVVLTMNQILVIYYLAGMFMVYMNGWPGFRDWLDIGTTLTVKVFKLGFVIAKEAWGILLTIKQILTGWL